MKTVYTVQPYEKGIRSDGWYEIESPQEAFDLISRFCNNAAYPVSVIFRKHEIALDCEICSAGSVKEEIVFEVREMRTGSERK